MKAMAVSSKPKTVNTNWLMSPYASWFFLNHNWSAQCKNTVAFASIKDPLNPVAYISQVNFFFFFAKYFFKVFIESTAIVCAGFSPTFA
jgi:hypothetical protein